MLLKEMIADYSLRHYKLVTWLLVIFTVVTAAMIPMIRVDTDPENMLSHDEPVRVFHDENKRRYSLNDMVVLGVINEKHPDGVFNVSSLTRIYELAEFAKTELRWPDPENPDNWLGIVEADLMAPSVVDHIGQGSPGEVRFEWLMPKPPAGEEEARAIRDKMMSNPMFTGTLVSEDGKALCLYLPLTRKDLSYRVYSKLNEKIATMPGDEQYHITGLPVAEDTFGVEMFIQMAVSAPLAMAVVFVLMLLFFRKPVLVISPMIIAMVAVISTMGLLIGFGFPVHIMSSMIPIFLMPIAVVDSVHILSEFFEKYTKEKGRRETIREVMNELFTPMLYTSLTTTAGFGSLALTPIPPVQVFGIFVAIGVMIAWVFTITFVPAYVMWIPETTLAHFGHAARHGGEDTGLIRLFRRVGSATYSTAKPILALVAILTGIAIYGISRIQINDNPVKWFSKSHPIRKADIALNAHFGGTYMAYLVLDHTETTGHSSDVIEGIRSRLRQTVSQLGADFSKMPTVAQEAESMLRFDSEKDTSIETMLTRLYATSDGLASDSEDPDTADAWSEIAAFFGLESERLKPFKQPEVLDYVDRLQDYLKTTGVVGKSSSIVDIVKKVHQELIDGKPESHRIPDRAGMVAECLIQYQSGHRPQDLWHFIRADYSSANIWVQLTSGDNKDMEKVVRAADEFFAKNASPVSLEHHWAGLTYINTVWQDRMVSGMLQSFLGSFLIVFVMMAILFRSLLWGLLSMIPLTITIVMIYGAIGLVGKDYDMPVAVLSALTLGMAVDFAIHFLERARGVHSQTGSWKAAASEMFEEPARAIGRNVLVIAIGFLPLLAAPLVPYKTVGYLMCAIMALSGIVTLFVLPSVMTVLEKRLFRPGAEPMGKGCNCVFCLVISLVSVAIIALNAYQFGAVGFNAMMWIGAVSIPVLGLICGMLSRRRACRNMDQKNV